MTAADESRVVWRHEIASVGLALGAAYLEGLAAARSEPRAEGHEHSYICYICGEPLAATPPAEGLLWHDDVICLGDDCEVVDRDGNHPTPEADAATPAEGLDVERIVRLTVHACRGRLLTAPADEEAAVQAALAALAPEQPE